MPVGRIEYLHLEPMNFGEFLCAIGKDKYATFIAQFQKLYDCVETSELREVIHKIYELSKYHALSVYYHLLNVIYV